MTQQKKEKIAAGLLVVLGLAIGTVGVIGMLAPPVITAVGFFVIAWALPRTGESGPGSGGF